MRRPNGVARRARRAAWRGAAVVLLAAVCPVCRADFAGFPEECTKLFTSAWGAPATRNAALKFFKTHDGCPHTNHVSSRGRAALIAANLVPDSSDPCYDGPLTEAVRAACGDSWRTLFRSNKWHPHGEGVLTFHEPTVAILISALVFFFVFYMVLILPPHHNSSKFKSP